MPINEWVQWNALKFVFFSSLISCCWFSTPFCSRLFPFFWFVSSAAKSFDFYQWNNTVRHLEHGQARQGKKVPKTKTVTIFHVWLLYMKQFVPFFGPFLMSLYLRRLVCESIVIFRLDYLLSSFDFRPNCRLSRTQHPVRWMIFENGQIEASHTKSYPTMRLGHCISTTKLLYLSSICIVSGIVKILFGSAWCCPSAESRTRHTKLPTQRQNEWKSGRERETHTVSNCGCGDNEKTQFTFWMSIVSYSANIKRIERECVSRSSLPIAMENAVPSKNPTCRYIVTLDFDIFICASR